MFLLNYTGKEKITDLLTRLGHMPLPPYISRDDENLDQERYQTVFSDKPGAVAAPTAGCILPTIFFSVKKKGVDNARLTLHVGAGPSSQCALMTLKNMKCIVNTCLCHKVLWIR